MAGQKRKGTRGVRGYPQAAVRLPPESHEKLQEIAAAEDRSVSSMIRIILERFLREHGGGPAPTAGASEQRLHHHAKVDRKYALSEVGPRILDFLEKSACMGGKAA